MGFNVTGFKSESFTQRTESVKVPGLKDFFSKGEKPVWIVRGLTGNEIGMSADFASRQSITKAVIEGVLSGKSKDIKDAVKSLTGRSDEIPEDTAKRIAHLKHGSVDPVCDEELAVKINKHFPVDFLRLTNTILTLSGQGSLPGKRKASGKTKKSK